MKFFLCAALVLFCGVANADLSSVPYNPEKDKSKLLSDIGIPEQDMILDRRCVVLKTEKWVKSITLDHAWTCVLVMTKNKLILTVYDSNTDKYSIFSSYNYDEIKSTALAEKETTSAAEGKTLQLEVTTNQEFLSIRAMRGKMGDRPFDSRGSRDAYDILKSKGVLITDSMGMTEIKLHSYSFFERKH